jgi:hypothetical protein
VPETKSLKSVSIAELELAISKAIAELVGQDVATSISSLQVITTTAGSWSGIQSYKLDVSIKVGQLPEQSDNPF